MKINFFTLLALLFTSAASFAQPAFTKAVLAEIGQEYQKDSKAFYTNRLAPEFRFMHPGGIYLNRNAIVAQPSQTILKSDILDPVIFQAGALAVVSGIHLTERNGPDGKPVAKRVGCTYTFQYRGNKWLFMASQQTDLAPTAAEQAAVRTVLETETRAFHEANYDLLQAQWALQKPYVERQQAMLQDAVGMPYLKGEKLTAFADSYFKTLKPSGRQVRFSDYDAHINGSMAWATYSQEKLDKEGNVVEKQREVRIFERDGSGWKIVFLSLQPMK